MRVRVNRIQLFCLSSERPYTNLNLGLKFDRKGYELIKKSEDALDKQSKEAWPEKEKKD